MRSLFVDDIYGAKPSHRYFDKALYRQRHDSEVQRFGPNGKDYKKSYHWYRSQSRHMEPIDRKDFPVKLLSFMHTTSKPQSPHDLTKSLVLSRKQKQTVTGKVTQNLENLNNKSSILTGSGKQSLSNSLSDFPDNPYFPHIYVDNNSGVKNKWRGKRHWQAEGSYTITIPKQQFIVAKTFRK